MDFVFHPDHSSNGYVYVYYRSGGERATRSVLSRFQVFANDVERVDPESETVILEIGRSFHPGSIQFGPDGLLYFVLLVALYSGLGVLAGAGKTGASLAGVGIGVGLLYALLFTFGGAAGGFIGPWINGGIHHLLLMLSKYHYCCNISTFSKLLYHP